MNVAFIGLGHLGGHLAASLLAPASRSTVHDRDPAAVAALVAAGATRRASPRAAAGPPTA